MIGVNLIPQAEVVARKRRRRLRAWSLAIVIAAAVGSAPVAVEFTRHHQVQSLRSEKGRVRRDIETTRAELNRLGLEIRDLQAQAARADALRTKRPWAHLLTLLSETLPQEMWLVAVATDPAAPRQSGPYRPAKRDPAKPDAPPEVVTLEAPRQLAVEGYALDYRNLYEFMSKLNQAEVFQTVTLTRANDEPVLNTSAVRFQILCSW